MSRWRDSLHELQPSIGEPDYDVFDAGVVAVHGRLAIEAFAAGGSAVVVDVEE